MQDNFEEHYIDQYYFIGFRWDNIVYAVIWIKYYKRACLDYGGLVLFWMCFFWNYSFFPCKKERRDKLRWVRYNKAYLPHPLGKRSSKNGNISVFFSFLHEMMWLFRRDGFRRLGSAGIGDVSSFNFWFLSFQLPPLTPPCTGGGHATLKHWSASSQRFLLSCNVMFLLFRDINLFL